jgi:hypothetical protein
MAATIWPGLRVDDIFGSCRIFRKEVTAMAKKKAAKKPAKKSKKK